MVWICTCMWERERETERGREVGRERERESEWVSEWERECVCVCVCVVVVLLQHVIWCTYVHLNQICATFLPQNLDNFVKSRQDSSRWKLLLVLWALLNLVAWWVTPTPIVIMVVTSAGAGINLILLLSTGSSCCCRFMTPGGGQGIRNSRAVVKSCFCTSELEHLFD